MPESIDAGMAEVRDSVMPMITQMEGCIGLSMLVDRSSGRCIVTSAWRSEEAMRATDEELQPIRERIGEMLGGSPQIDEWEIAVLHRDHQSTQGACVRVTWMQVDSADLDRAIDVYRLASLPKAEELAGFCSASLLVDRSSGRAVSSVTYDSVQAMESNREAAAALRSAGSKDAGAELLDVGEFELALAHLRVPELT
ncbi:putative quinol monooxygenase [Kribbella catacumbae]|uniref:putative quinol monooxygenase n=1 Tax=Kribbella catacumbae TaxID=460086 RepID=UPI00037802F8|nr:antibiotic biosynthesis monooxygenase [Kribbella catacumbae]